MADRAGERMTHQVWRAIPGTSALELVCGPFRQSPDGDSPKPADAPEKE